MWHRRVAPELVTALDAAAAKAKAKTVEAGLDELEDEFDRVLLINRALWDTIKELHGLTDDQLYDRVRTLDLQDGRLDGKLRTTETRNCPSCNRVLNRRHMQCIYCGNRDFGGDPFDTVR